jgi:hypothetical protein
MLSTLLSYCFGEVSLGVNRPILHQSIAIVKNQIGVDFDIPQSNLVGLQVDFSNQKSNRYERGRQADFPYL